MTDEDRDSYDAMAGLYAALVPGDLDRLSSERDWLAAFAELAACRQQTQRLLRIASDYWPYRVNCAGRTVESWKTPN